MAPSPLELARMHEAELKQCFKQYSVLGALISQIMTGRTVLIAGTRYKVTGAKLHTGAVLLYGKPESITSKRKAGFLCTGLGGVEIVT